MLGQGIAKKLLELGHVVVTTSRRLDCMDTKSVYLDLQEPESFLRLVQGQMFNAVIACAGVTRISDCESHREYSQRVNVDGLKVVLSDDRLEYEQVLYVSTSLVFDGSQPRFNIGHQTNPTTVYGEQKATIERWLQHALRRKSCIIRFSKILNNEFPLFCEWCRQLREGQSVSAYADKFLAPVSLRDSVRACMDLIEGSHTGIFQLSAEDQISYYEAAQCIASQLGLDMGLIRKSFKGADVGSTGSWVTLTSHLPTAPADGFPRSHQVVSRFARQILD